MGVRFEFDLDSIIKHFVGQSTYQRKSYVDDAGDGQGVHGDIAGGYEEVIQRAFDSGGIDYRDAGDGTNLPGLSITERAERSPGGSNAITLSSKC
jgi:hypothetical protein